MAYTLLYSVQHTVKKVHILKKQQCFASLGVITLWLTLCSRRAAHSAKTNLHLLAGSWGW